MIAEEPETLRLEQILTDAFNDREFERFCFHYFREVYNATGGKSKGEKAFELVAYCDRRGLLVKLRELLQQMRPECFPNLPTPAHPSPTPDPHPAPPVETIPAAPPAQPAPTPRTLPPTPRPRSWLAAGGVVLTVVVLAVVGVVAFWVPPLPPPGPTPTTDPNAGRIIPPTPTAEPKAEGSYLHDPDQSLSSTPSIQATLSMLGFSGVTNVVISNTQDIDKELIAVWKNAQTTLKIDIPQDVEIAEEHKSYVILVARAEASINPDIPWQINSKRKALEKIALHVPGFFTDLNTAEYFFVRGVIENADFDTEKKSATIWFRIDLEKE
jgi:hypothetical protein